MVVAYIEENPVAVGQLVLSLALVITTFWYASNTSEQTDEMKKSRQATSDQTEEMQKTREATIDQTEEMVKTREIDNQPVVKGSVKFWAPTVIAIVVKNTGNISAHNVSVTTYFEDINREPIEFKTPILSTDEEVLFRIPIESDNRDSMVKYQRIENKIEELDSDGVLYFEAIFESPFGEHYERAEHIDVLEVINNQPQMILKSENEKMRKALEGIEENLESVGKSINQEYTDQESRNQIYQEVKKQIEDAGVINYDKLKSKVYVEQKTLDSILSRMQESGIIEIDDDVHILVSDDFDIEYVGE